MSYSEDLYKRAKKVTPGGVHSPVRSLQSVNGHPIFFDSAHGAELIDVEGKPYVDFCMSFGPLILGHANPDVHRAASSALDAGWSYGAAETASLELAELITGSIPWVESIRFVNSGTEAVMSALRLARAATGRNKVVKFAGCYHGHTDAMLIDSGSGLAETASASSEGITPGVKQDTLVAPLNDLPALQQLFTDHGDDIACVIIEPVPANYGLLPQTDEFIKEIRALCDRYSALLIFDEVITGFRLGFQGYAAVVEVMPDLVTYGKVIGGGFPVGAFGGKREIMELIAPAGPVYQAGTLSANPVAMKAGLATLQQLLGGEVYNELNEKAALLRELIGGAIGIQQAGSLFWVYADTPAGTTIRNINEIPDAAIGRYPALFRSALDNGVYLPPSAYEVGFLSAAHNDQQLQLLADTVHQYMESNNV